MAGVLVSGAQTTGTDLVPVHEKIIEAVNDAAVGVMGETGWRVEGLSAWLWVTTSKEATIYVVADGRGLTRHSYCAQMENHLAQTHDLVPRQLRRPPPIKGQ